MKKISSRLKSISIRFSSMCSLITSKMILRKMNRVTKSIRLSALLINKLLRYHEESKCAEENSPDSDTLAYIGTAKLFDIKYDYEEYKEFEHENRKVIEDQIHWALHNNEIRSWMAVNYELQAFSSQLDNLKDKQNELREKAKALNTKTIKITNNNIRDIEYIIRTRIKFVESLIDGKKSPKKISITATQLSTGITIVSSIFLVSGYLFMHYFLGQFGVDVSNYFSLTDYLATSIEKLQYVAISAIVGGISIAWGYLSSPDSFSLVNEYYKSKLRYFVYFLIIFLIFTELLSYLKNPLEFDSSSIVTTVFVSALLIVFLSIKLLPRKYFEKPIMVQFIIFFLLYFFMYLFIGITTTTSQYKNSKLKTLKKYGIFLDDKCKIKTDSMVILASNSRYYFLYDVSSKETFVIPERYVNYIQIIK
jgi:hypothetical protein